MFEKRVPSLLATMALAGSLFVGASAVQAQETLPPASGSNVPSQEVTEEIPEKIYDLRGDDGILYNLRPTGISFISPNRILLCENDDQRLHIFDTEGRRFKRLNIPRDISNPCYSALTKLSQDNFLAIGSHSHINNDVRLLNNHSVMHLYTLRGEMLTGESAKVDYDPIVALRKTGYLGTYAERRMHVSGLAVAPEANKMYISLSQPLEEDGSVIIYEANLEEVLACDKRAKFTQHNYGIFPRADETTEQYYRVTDICHISGRGLLILMASAKPNGYAFGANQLWLKPDNSEEAYLLAEDIAPGNYGSAVDARVNENGSYTIVIAFDNDPGKTSTPSRLMVLENINL